MVDENNTGWMLFVGEGSYDDFRLNLIGYFADEQKAKNRFNFLAAALDLYKAENQRPKEEAYTSKGKVDHMAHNQAVRIWRDKNSDNELFEVRYYVLEQWADGDTEFLKQYKSFNHRQSF